MSDHWFMTTPIREISVDDAAYTIKLLRNEVLKERIERQEAQRKLKVLIDDFEAFRKA